jgi:hypothetical protein
MLISCKKEVPVPNNFIASQGSYIGVVHLAYGDPGGQAIVYRLNEDTGEWQEISWTWSGNFDDNGTHLPDHYIVPGKEYRYKMQVYKEGEGDEFSDFTNEITGYAFKAEPAEITSVKREENGDKADISVSWKNPNDLSEIKNLTGIEYQIYRAEDSDIGNYTFIYKREYIITSPSDIQYEYSHTDTWLDAEKTYMYKIKTRYRYDYTSSSGDYHDNQYYETEGTGVEEDDSGNGDDNPTADYTTTDFGEITAAASGEIIAGIKEKVVNGEVYLGVLIGNTVEATPSLFKYNGSAFENVWTCEKLSSSKSIHYAVASSGTSYVAGFGDSLCIYRREGASWSDDIAPDGISLAGIEIFDDELYLLSDMDDVAKIMKYNGSSWDTVGETFASGSMYGAKIEAVDGNLYFYYTLDNTLHIRHLSGTNWVTDLEWTQEWLGTVELAKNGGDLYFSTSTGSTAEYDGGIYKVTGPTSVENYIPDDAADSWFLQGAFTMSADDDGNLIAVSIKAEVVSDNEILLYPSLILYNGSQWYNISGDFTDGRDPIGLSTVGNEVFYFYGEKATQNSAQQSTVLKAKKLTKQK